MDGTRSPRGALDSGHTGSTAPAEAPHAARSSEPQKDSTGRFTWLRALLPAVAVIAWVLVTGWGGQTFGQLADVTTNDQATFLPADAESTRALDVGELFNEEEVVPATVIAEANSGSVDESAQQQATEAAEAFAELSGVETALPPQVSEDERAVQILVLLQDQAADEGAVLELREAVAAELSDSDWQAYVTGPAAIAEEFSQAFAGIDGLLLGVTLVAVFIILVLVYRSVLLPILVLLSSMGALCAAVVVIYLMAAEEWIQLNGQAQGILSILVIGAATDYSLLLVARYREELSAQSDRFAALWKAWKRSLPPVLASGGTVAVGLLCLLAADLNSTRSLGPVASTGIVFSMLATMTFLPAMLALCGRPAFWPKIPRVKPEFAEGVPGRRARREKNRSATLFTKAAGLVRRRPRVVWLSVTALMLLASTGVLGLRAEGVPQSDLVLGENDAKLGQAVLEEHYDAGTGAPADIFVPAEHASEALELLQDHEGVGEAHAVGEGGQPAESPEEALTADVAAELLNGTDSSNSAEELAPDGDQHSTGTEYVELAATLTDPGDSEAAQETIASLRADFADFAQQQGLDAETAVLVGGPTATELDTAETGQRDLQVVIPIVLAVILVFLVVLLRSIVAPVLLLTTTALSFLAALGVSALVFNHVFGFPGADPTVPLFGFMFLTALGVDYTIFLSTRAREETPVRGPREGMLHALVVTGGVITSAGIVLAATFSALAVLPLMFMVQLAFLVAFGVLIDTFLVRTFQVPGLAVDMGRGFWWPAKLMPKAPHCQPHPAHMLTL